MKNESLINKIKLRQVKQICDLAALTSIVRRTVIFGSSITANCTENSDIDICFDISCDSRDMRLYTLRKQVNKICDYNCDFVIYNHINQDLKKEIDQKGVVVYEA